MPSKVFVLKLTGDERAELRCVTKQNKAARWKVQRAQALLTCDQSPEGPAWTDDRVALAVGCSRRSVENWRKQAVEEGPLSLLAGPRPGGRGRAMPRRSGSCWCATT